MILPTPKLGRPSSPAPKHPKHNAQNKTRQRVRIQEASLIAQAMRGWSRS